MASGSAAPAASASTTPAATAAGTFAVGAGLREKKRLVVDAMSPSHMATVAQAEPSSVERLRALILAGTSKETRDRAAAERTLEATVAGHEQLLQVLRDVALEHDSHLAPLLQRTAQLETSVGAAVAHASTAKANMEAAQTALNTELSEYAQRMSVEMAASGERVTALESRTAGSFAQA
jgi:hypothetical protein